MEKIEIVQEIHDYDVNASKTPSITALKKIFKCLRNNNVSITKLYKYIVIFTSYIYLLYI